MVSSLKTGMNVFGLNDSFLSSKPKGFSGFCSSSGVVQIAESKAKESPILNNDFLGKTLVFPFQTGANDWKVKAPANFSVQAQASICVSRALRWWEKTLRPNMIEIHSAKQLVESLLDAGDRLVVIDFYSPGCGGCKTIHPKLCQLAESNPNAIFLKVNYEEVRVMCECLNIHVLPFFRLYRGAEGRLCSFSCTNATIKKFKDALAKHGTDRCSLGPAKGLDEAEILKLAAAGELSVNLPLPLSKEERMEDSIMKTIDLGGVWRETGYEMHINEAL